MRKENLCTGCGCDNFVAECNNCPRRVNAQLESTAAIGENKGTADQNKCGGQIRKRKAERQCHQTLTINLSFPDGFKASIFRKDGQNQFQVKLKDDETLIKAFEGWKEKRYGGEELVKACNKAIETLLTARQLGGVPRAAWWKNKGKFRIKLEFSNHKSMELFKGKIAA